MWQHYSFLVFCTSLLNDNHKLFSQIFLKYYRLITLTMLDIKQIAFYHVRVSPFLLKWVVKGLLLRQVVKPNCQA